MNRAYFPLRSSVELFADPSSPEPVSRAKHAAILYDEVAFEIGMLEASITADGSFLNYRPPGMIGAEDRARARKLTEPGEGVEIRIGFPSGIDVPVPEEFTFFRGELQARYAAEWHSGVLDDLRELKPSWAQWVYLPDELLASEGLVPLMSSLKGALEDANPADRAEVIHRSFVIDALSRDAAVAAGLGASVHVTSLFEPLLDGLRGFAPEHPGLRALEIVVPGVANLPWEAISEFREHPGSQDARGKLRDIEERALADGPEPTEASTRIAQEVTRDLFAAIEDLKGSVPQEIAKEAANTAISSPSPARSSVPARRWPRPSLTRSKIVGRGTQP